jgi:hypothetical protein
VFLVAEQGRKGVELGMGNASEEKKQREESVKLYGHTV